MSVEARTSFFKEPLQPKTRAQVGSAGSSGVRKGSFPFSRVPGGFQQGFSRGSAGLQRGFSEGPSGVQRMFQQEVSAGVCVSRGLNIFHFF